MMRPRLVHAACRSLLLAAALSPFLLSIPATHAASSPTPLSDGRVLGEFAKQAQDQALPEAERLQMIVLLGQWGNDEVRAPLIALLGDPLPSIRAGSARALGWKGNHAAVPLLRARLEASEEESAVKVAALEALGRIGDDSARAAVLSATRDTDAKVRAAAFWGLTFENLQSPTDRVSLLRQMAEDKALDRFMRCQAIQGLGGLKDTGSSKLLLGLLEHEPVSAMPQLKGTLTERDIMGIRYREARDVKAWAARVLWALDEKAAIPLLLKTADEPDDFFLRFVSVEALAAWKVPEALPLFLKRLEDPFDQSRVAALWGLGAIGDRSVVDPVLARLSDRVVEVRAQAVNTLAELGDPRVRPQLEALQQKDIDPRVQEALNKALSRLAP